MIIVLVAIAVTAVLVLFYGAVRPEGDLDASEGGVKGGLGWLTPTATLDFDDVAKAACADQATRSLVVEPNQPCDIALAERTEIRLCVADPAEVDVQVVIAGEEYPDQEFTSSELACGPDDEPIRIYDTKSVMTITCDALTACRLAVADSR